MEPVLFFSTNGNSPKVQLKQALLQGQAPDRGLYFPDRIPTVNREELLSFRNKTYAEIAFSVLSPYMADVLKPEVLREICEESYNFDIPLEDVKGCENVKILRLDRGPTASFKDFAARLMARLMGRFVQEEGRELTILTATSGDTGAAVASAFYGVANIRVLVLFPEKEVSERQRKQMTSLGGNITTLAVQGKFDDCQAMVKRAFADFDLNKQLNLSSANSINIGRLLPQSVYYFYAYSRLNGKSLQPILFSVPSGNFGNMMGGMIAWKMGLPIKRMIISVNENDEFPIYLSSGKYHKIEPSKNCISNAMNVGHPSNLARLIKFYHGQMDEMGRMNKEPDFTRITQNISSFSVSDEGTRQSIKDAWNQHQLLLEPHGAVGWNGYWRWIKEYSEDAQLPAVLLETAHPAKFPKEIKNLLGFEPITPPSLARIDHLAESYERIDTDFAAFKDYLMRF